MKFETKMAEQIRLIKEYFEKHRNEHGMTLDRAAEIWISKNAEKFALNI